MGTHTPRLVVLTGYPRAGKSEVAARLMEYHGYVRLGTDDLRSALYGPDWFRILTDAKDEVAFNLVFAGADQAVRRGLDVVVDSTAYSHAHREQLMLPWISDLPLERHLVWVDASKQMIHARQLAAGRRIEDLALWDHYWEDPVPGEYTLTQYRNDSAEDLERIFADVDRRFARYAVARH